MNGHTERILLLRIGQHSHALRLSSVAGVADCGHVHPVPGAPAPVLGVVEWQGNLVTVLDLPDLLRIDAPSGPACLIRLASPHLHIALRVPAELKTTSATSLPTIDPVELLREIPSIERAGA
jgi:chemotaxis signal transduction protein